MSAKRQKLSDDTVSEFDVNSLQEWAEDGMDDCDCAPLLAMIDKDPTIVRQKDKHGMTILNYVLSDPYTDNEHLASLVARCVDLYPEGCEKHLPLADFTEGMKEQDYDGVRCMVEALEDRPPRLGQAEQCGVLHVIQAFPEGIFPAGLFGVIAECCNLEREMDDFEATALYGFLLMTFPNGLREIPPSDSNRRVPLHCAASYAWMARMNMIFPLLISDETASTPDKTQHGRLALHLAVASQGKRRMGNCDRPNDVRVTVSLDIVKMLVECNPKALHVCDDQGHTPWELACLNQCSADVTYYLLRYDPIAAVQHVRQKVKSTDADTTEE